MVDKTFIDIYGNAGYLLRNLETNTSSRIAMFSSLVYLQKQNNGAVKFDDFYNLSLDKTEEKLEKSSFKSFITKLEEELDREDLIIQTEIDGDTAFECSDYLLNRLDEANNAFDKMLS